MKNGTARLEDVAARAKVSKMTVSLCLRDDGGHGRMSPATRERVLKAIRELDYRPNLRGRALRLGRTNVIAFYAGHGFVNVRSPFFTEIVSGLQEGCEIVRKDLLLHSTFHNSSSDDIFGELLDGRIDGLIASMPPDSPLAERLPGSSFAVVAVADELEGVPSILVDDAGGARMIADHLYERGHRRVVYAVNQIEPASGRRRRVSFLDRAKDLGLSVEIISPCDDGWAPVIRDVLSRGVTAIACWNDILAREFVEHLLEMGIDVPGQLAVTGFDGCPMPCREALPLTTIAAPWSEVAKSAVLHLNARMAGEAGSPRIVLPVQFVRGATS